MMKSSFAHAALAIVLAAGALGAQTPRTITFDEAISIALRQNTTVKQAENAAPLGTTAVRQQKLQLLPSLSLNLSGANDVGRNFNQTEGQITTQSTNALSFADQLDQRRGGSLSLGVSIPLFGRGSTSVATQRAQIAEDDARLALQAQRQEVALQVRRAVLDYQAARERLAAAGAQRKAAEQAATVSEQRYQLGAATLVELAQARSSQVQAASAEVSARYEVVFQRALMSYYAGELDPAHVTLGA